MENNTEIESENCKYDQQDDDGDKGGGGDNCGEPPLDATGRIQYYASCKLAYNRQLVGRILVEIFRGAVDDGTELDVTEVMQPVYGMAEDSEVNVRRELVEQLPHVAMICQEAPERFGNVLSDHLIHIIVDFHHDRDPQVRQSTHIALLKLIERGLLDKDSAEFIIAPTLLQMPLHQTNPEFYRVIDGMRKVAPLLDPETAERLFLKRFLEMCNDDNSFIRKSCATHFGEFAAAMTKETLYGLLLPTYENLCKDPVWSVRKCCVDAIVSVACCVSLEYRHTTLSRILANHLSDDSKWVRSYAFQILGPFITTFAKRFTGFAYKQYGELVLTDQNGTELRYNIISFLGMGEMSAPCTSASEEDVGNDNERLNPQCKGELAMPNVDIRDRCKTKCTTDANKENVPVVSSDTLKQFELKISLGYSTEQENVHQLTYDDGDANKTIESHDLYNPFLYYYIPPDLPLDQDLIDAATSDYKLTNQPTNDTTEEYIGENSSSTVLNEVVNKDEPETIGETEKLDVTSDIILNNDANEIPTTNDNQNSTQEIWKSMDDTINMSSISLNKNDSIIETNTTPFVEYVLDKNGQGIVSKELVDFFVSMADPEAYFYHDKWNSVEIPRFCAFCFPAVVLTLGKENWPLLKVAYTNLSEAREYKVRRTLASSIHEVAMILGEKLAAKDLLPIYDGFIKDLDEVRIGALKYLATFLKVLNQTDRSQFLPRLQAFLSTDNEWNWRFREEVASQFLQAIPLYSTADVSTHIAPLSIPLLLDKVAAVRQMALELVTEIIAYLSSDEDLVTAMIQELRVKLVGLRSRWTCRQTFALLCASLLKNNAISGELFAEHLLSPLLALASDVVPNVRLVVIKTLRTQVVNINDSLTSEQIVEIEREIKRLRRDRDRDVCIHAGGFASTKSVGELQRLYEIHKTRQRN